MQVYSSVITSKYKLWLMIFTHFINTVQKYVLNKHNRWTILVILMLSWTRTEYGWQLILRFVAGISWLCCYPTSVSEISVPQSRMSKGLFIIHTTSWPLDTTGFMMKFWHLAFLVTTHSTSYSGVLSLSDPYICWCVTDMFCADCKWASVNLAETSACILLRYTDV